MSYSTTKARYKLHKSEKFLQLSVNFPKLIQGKYCSLPTGKVNFYLFTIIVKKILRKLIFKNLFEYKENVVPYTQGK